MRKQLIIVLLIFILLKDHPITNASRTFEEKDIETILALENESVNIVCKTDVPMAYCGFIHPNGSRYSFAGPTLTAGHCAIQINATYKDEGQWRCHIGNAVQGRIATGVEIMKKIQVRVADQIAAIQRNITVVHGKPITLSCATTKGLISIRYCRFEPPTGEPFGIDSKVTAKNAILNRYFFPSNKSLDRGDCAVTIRKVKYEDVGTWTCGAGLEDGKEYIDVINLEVEGFYTISKASATGITFGAISIILFLGVLGFVVWKQRRFLGSRPRGTPPPAEEHELEHLEASPRRSPQPARNVPQVIVESPSEPSSSPAQS